MSGMAGSDAAAAWLLPLSGTVPCGVRAPTAIFGYGFTVKIGAIEIGSRSVSSSFLKDAVKLRCVGSSFLKYRNCREAKYFVRRRVAAAQ